MISGTVPDPSLEVCPIKSTTGAYKETMILRDDNYTDIWMNIRKNSKLPLIFIFVCFRTKPPLTEYWRNSWYQCRRCSLPSSFDSLGVLHLEEVQEEPYWNSRRRRRCGREPSLRTLRVRPGPTGRGGGHKWLLRFYVRGGDCCYKRQQFDVWIPLK